MNPGVGCHFLPRGIFPIQGLSPSLLYWELDSLPLRHLERLTTLIDHSYKVEMQ